MLLSTYIIKTFDITSSLNFDTPPQTDIVTVTTNINIYAADNAYFVLSFTV
jgi:hypothetical protein